MESKFSWTDGVVALEDHAPISVKMSDPINIRPLPAYVGDHDVRAVVSRGGKDWDFKLFALGDVGRLPSPSARVARATHQRNQRCALPSIS